MSKKLPMILAAMLAVLAVPATLGADAPADTAAPAADTAAPAADAAAPAAEAAPAKKAKKRAHSGKHHGGKKHKGAAYDAGGSTGGNSPQGSYRKSYDENCGELPKADCAPCEDLSPKAGPAVSIGQKAPS